MSHKEYLPAFPRSFGDHTLAIHSSYACVWTMVSTKAETPFQCMSQAEKYFFLLLTLYNLGINTNG